MSRIFMPMMLVFGVVVAPFTAFAEDFDIHYELNGGTAASSGMPTTYTAGVETIIDGVPTRANSGFAGWCVDSGLTDCAATQTILDTDTGDKTFYASWTCNNGYGAALDGQSCTANQYNVTYDCGTGTGTPPAGATVSYDSNFSPVMVMQNLCEKTGYILSGWAVSGTSDVKSGTFKWTYLGDKTLTAQWVEFDPKFTITTTNMSAGDMFKYWQGSEGLFYVDWGDGTLQTINYIGTIQHTYTTAGVHTINFGGVATNHPQWSDNNRFGSVSFGERACNPYGGDESCLGTHVGTPLFVAGISGSLGAIYPSLQNGRQPVFLNTFYGCTNLTGSIPSTLFNGVTGNTVAMDGNYQNNALMFQGTFHSCSGLTGEIPADLFGGLKNAATSLSMFQSTFAGCSGLTGSIPSTLFSGVVGIPRAGLFSQTFAECSGLTGPIPENLFAGITGSADADRSKYTVSEGTDESPEYVTYTRGATNAFGGTFGNCSGLTEIPENLFGRVVNGDYQGITDYAAHLFSGAFVGLVNVTSIPGNLFGRMVDGTYKGITGAARAMFKTTFQGMCSLTSPIPSNLFAGISGTAKDMFRSTFNMGRCGQNGLPESGLSGFVDPALFAGVNRDSTNIFYLTFRNTQMDTVCPCGYHSVTTAWGIDTIPASNTYNPSTDPEGKNTPRAVCAEGLKPNEHYYTGDNNETACTTDCDFAINLKTKNGSDEDAYPLLSEKLTTPALVVQSGGTQCYVPLETGVDTFNLKWNETIYHAGRLDEVVLP